MRCVLFHALTFCGGARGKTPRLAHQAERLLVGYRITLAAARRALSPHVLSPCAVLYLEVK